MASITPTNGRVAFVAAWDPHTYWELNSTNLGTNYGDDATSGGGDNTNVGSGDISTQESYDGMATQNDPPTNGAMDIYLINDAAALVYIPANLTHNTVRGLWQNGGGTNSQGAFLRATTTGVEVALAHNNGGDLGDYLIEEIPDADLPGWFCISWQYNSHGGVEGDCALWLNGTAVRSGTRVYTLDYGSGNPDFGDNSGGREPNASQVLDPASYTGGDWAGDGGNINGTGILIANFTCDNPSPGGSDTSAGNGDTWHTDYYDDHVVVSGGTDALLADDVSSTSETTSPALGQEHSLTAASVQSQAEVSTPALGQEHALTATSTESASEVTAPTVGQEHALTADDAQSTSELTAPALQSVSGTDNLLADDAESASEVTQPALGQEHGLTSTDVESASELTSPALGQGHALTAASVSSVSEVSAPTLAEFSGLDPLLADDVESQAEINTPSITQVHALLANDLEASSEVSTGVLNGGGLDGRKKWVPVRKRYSRGFNIRAR